MTDGKVALWIVEVNVIKSTHCFDSFYKIVSGYVYLLLMIPLIRVVLSLFFTLTFVGAVPF